jgi:hypothetical protein
VLASKLNLSLPVVLAALIGVAQMYFLVFFWTYFSIYSPLPHWLKSLGMRGSPFFATIFVADLLVNVALCLPAAYGLCRLKPRRLVLYLALAIIPGFLWQYRLFFGDASLFNDWVIFVPGVFMSLIPLPFAALVSRRWFDQGRLTNGSSGLRGSSSLSQGEGR